MSGLSMAVVDSQRDESDRSYKAVSCDRADSNHNRFASAKCVHRADSDLGSSRYGQPTLRAMFLLKDEPLPNEPGRIRHVEPEQHLRTEKGRAEVLFALGTYLRLGANAEIRNGIRRSHVR